MTAPAQPLYADAERLDDELAQAQVMLMDDLLLGSWRGADVGRITSAIARIRTVRLLLKAVQVRLGRDG